MSELINEARRQWTVIQNEQLINENTAKRVGKGGHAIIDAIEHATPYVGTNGNWWVGATDTGIPAQGEPGVKGDTGEKGDRGDGHYKIFFPTKEYQDGNGILPQYHKICKWKLKKRQGSYYKSVYQIYTELPQFDLQVTSSSISYYTSIGIASAKYELKFNVSPWDYDIQGRPYFGQTKTIPTFDEFLTENIPLGKKANWSVAGRIEDIGMDLFLAHVPSEDEVWLVAKTSQYGVGAGLNPDTDTPVYEFEFTFCNMKPVENIQAISFSEDWHPAVKEVITNATHTNDGLMSAADKISLDASVLIIVYNELHPDVGGGVTLKKSNYPWVKAFQIGRTMLYDFGRKVLGYVSSFSYYDPDDFSVITMLSDSNSTPFLINSIESEVLIPHNFKITEVLLSDNCNNLIFTERGNPSNTLTVDLTNIGSGISLAQFYKKTVLITATEINAGGYVNVILNLTKN